MVILRISDLYYFKTLCEKRSFTITAKIHFISQPKLSIAIKRLEDELGVKLILREKFIREFKITSDGLKLLEFINYFDYKVMNLKKSLKHEKRELNIGVPKGEGYLMIQQYLKDLYEREDVDINLIEININDLKNQSVLENLDYCFTCYKSGNIDTKNKRIFLRKGNIYMFTKGEKLKSVEELNEKVIFCLKKHTYHYEIMLEVINKFNVQPKKIIFLENFELIKIFMEKEDGVCIAMECAFKEITDISKTKIKNYTVDIYLEEIKEK